MKQGFLFLIFFLIPCLLVLNLWCIYNYNKNGFYGLFPGSGTLVSRNAIIASINSYNKVSVEYQPVLTIFLKAKETYQNRKQEEMKGSFSSIDRFSILEDLYSGYVIYGIAYPELVKYFDLEESSGEYMMNKKLKRFYKEIVKQNKEFIWKLRFYSLLSSFRASTSGILPSDYGKINLNILSFILN